MNHTPWSSQAQWISPLGPITLAATETGLAGLWFEGQQHHPGPLMAPVSMKQPFIAQAIEELQAYFNAGLRRFSVPLDLQGTPFQRTVWQALLGIPCGQTCSYAQLAHTLGKASAARATGAAVGRNPVSIIVPCHRVLGQGGSLTGYAGGLPRKQALLQLEGAAVGWVAHPGNKKAQVNQSLGLVFGGEGGIRTRGGD